MNTSIKMNLAAAARRPKNGRPPYIPTTENRRQVRHLAAVGIRHSDLATALGITPKTLRKHFRDELSLGAIEANIMVLKTLFRLATEGRNATAAIFWAKTRCGFTQRGVIPPSEDTSCAN